MIQVNAMGDACPIPVVKTIKAMNELQGAGEIEVLVDKMKLSFGMDVSKYNITVVKKNV